MVHICLFDRQCLKEWRDYGAPLRVYWGLKKEHHLTLLTGSRRSKKVWCCEVMDTDGRVVAPPKKGCCRETR